LTLVDVARGVTQGVRGLVAGAFLLSVIVAATHWAVRRGTLNAFGALARFVRGWSDPLLRPLERRIVRAGGNPQDAPLWLAGLTLVGGLVLIYVVGWILNLIFQLAYASQFGPRGAAQLVVHYVFNILQLAILVRVIVSWFGVSPYARWLRPVRWLTDWLLEPLQKVIPPLGMLDVSPLVAYFGLYLVEKLVMGAFF
jgi:YggT family protein